jgi:putative hemolysin
VSQVPWDILIVLLIVFVGGFFAAAEMALVSLREGQVRAISQRGKRGQRAARLAQDPNRFLSAVQIGVTVATLLSGTFGAATLASYLRTALLHQGLSDGLASTLSLAVVTIGISFFSLVLGELAPKRIALQRSVRISLFAAPVLDRIAVLARPVVWLLSKSVNLVVRLLGGDPDVGRGVTARPGGGQPGARRGRAEHRQRGLRRGQAPAPRGPGAQDRGRVPGRRHPDRRGGEDRGGRAALALPRLPGFL